MRFPYTLPMRTIAASDMALSAIFVAVPAFMRVLPARTSAPVARSTWTSTITPDGSGLQVTAAVRGFFSCGGERCFVLPVARGKGVEPWETALSQLLDVEGIDLVCAPTLTTLGRLSFEEMVAVQARILERCHERGDCFAILDSREGASDHVVRAQLASLWQRIGDDERLRNGALYHSWLSTDGGLFQPPSGHVAGIYALGDRRQGPHQAPANQPLPGVLELAEAIDDRRQQTINRRYPHAAVNCLRAFPGRGIRIWGARTLVRGADPTWSFIGVRRLFLYLGRRLVDATAWAAFAPNDLQLWIRLTRLVQGELLGLYQRGALQGRTAAEAFYVKCDDETNPPAVREHGRVVVEIGLAPARPAEFIRLRLTQQASGATVSAIG